LAPSSVPLGSGRLSLTTLETLNSGNDLSEAAFETGNATAWENLQIALSASLPPNIIYNLTVYNVNSGRGGDTLYTAENSVSNAANLGISSEASSYLVSSSNVTFNPTPQKIGETASGGGGITLYVLNCSDSDGWWITGYNAQSLAGDLYNLLSPYFAKTVVIQNTAQFGELLNGTPLHGESLQNAVIINTCGEAVPIPAVFNTSPYSNDGYAQYCYLLGQRANQYNWTWTSIVGYPFYYVTNTGVFTGANDQNGWGIFGMKCVGQAGLNSFLRGLNGESYVTDTVGWITLGGGNNPASEQVTISPATQALMNYYGIYPSIYQTATRAVPSTIEGSYSLVAESSVFTPKVDGGKTWLAGSTFAHVDNTGSIHGKLIPVGLTRSTDIRITALAILSYYQPRIYSSDFNSYDTSRLVVLQLGLVGGT
jgi:hypothetical protein